jgi:hypothetical protein
MLASSFHGLPVFLNSSQRSPAHCKCFRPSVFHIPVRQQYAGWRARMLALGTPAVYGLPVFLNSSQRSPAPCKYFKQSVSDIPVRQQCAVRGARMLAPGTLAVYGLPVFCDSSAPVARMLASSFHGLPVFLNSSQRSPARCKCFKQSVSDIPVRQQCAVRRARMLAPGTLAMVMNLQCLCLLISVLQ